MTIYNVSNVIRFRNFYRSLVGLPLVNSSIGFTIMLIQSRSIEIALVFVPFMAVPSIISAFIIRWSDKTTQSKEQTQ